MSFIGWIIYFEMLDVPVESPTHNLPLFIYLFIQTLPISSLHLHVSGGVP